MATAKPPRKPRTRQRVTGPNRRALVAVGQPYATPRTLTPEIADEIAKFIRMGDRPFVAAELCGVPRRTFYDWMAKGEADVLDALNTPYADLVHKIEAAESRAEHSNVVVIQTAARGRFEGDWKAAMAWLARRRDGWQDRRELTGKGGAPLFGASGFDELSDEEIEERLSGLRNRGGSARGADRAATPRGTGAPAGSG